MNIKVAVIDNEVGTREEVVKKYFVFVKNKKIKLLCKSDGKSHASNCIDIILSVVPEIQIYNLVVTQSAVVSTAALNGLLICYSYNFEKHVS